MAADLNPPRTDLLRWDEETDEPYMIIPRFPELRLTPWREGDADTAVRLFNEPSIAKFSFRRSVPFRHENLQWMRENVFAPAAQHLETTLRPILRPSANAPIVHPLPRPAGPVPFFPLIIIRYQPTGQMIGDFQLIQHSDPSAPPEEQAAAFGGQAPQTVPAEKQTWELVYNLFPEYTGRGIGGAVLDAVLEGWVRWVGIGTVMAGAQTDNTGSSGLVRSRGFKVVRTFMEKWPEDKGGGEREIAHWELKMEDHKTRLVKAE